MPSSQVSRTSMRKRRRHQLLADTLRALARLGNAEDGRRWRALILQHASNGAGRGGLGRTGTQLREGAIARPRRVQGMRPVAAGNREQQTENEKKTHRYLRKHPTPRVHAAELLRTRGGHLPSDPGATYRLHWPAAVACAGFVMQDRVRSVPCSPNARMSPLQSRTTTSR